MDTNRTLTFIISTIDEGIKKIDQHPIHPDVGYLIVHQTSHENKADHQRYFDDHLKHRLDTTYVQIYSRGVAKSRNHGLNLCNTPYAYLLDDDVTLHEESIAKIFSAITAKPLAPIIAFKKTRHISKIQKPSAKIAFSHLPKIKLLGVCTIEILFKVAEVKNKSIEFDENFGLGSKCPSGEENIFLADCYDKGLKTLQCNLITAAHPNETSGSDFFSTKEKVHTKKRVLARFAGGQGLTTKIIFFIYKSPTLIKNGKFFFFARRFFT